MKVKGEVDRNKLGYRQSTSAVIINKKNRILMVQKVGWRENEWDIPGGGVDAKETASEAIMRELKEELGCSDFEILKISQKIDCYEWSDELILHKQSEGKAVFRGQERKQFLVRLLSESSKIKVQAEEIRKLKWIYPEEVSAYCVFPGQLEKLKSILREFGLVSS